MSKALRPFTRTPHTSHHLITLCGSMCMLHSFIVPTSSASPWSVALSLPPVLHLWLHQLPAALPSSLALLPPALHTSCVFLCTPPMSISSTACLMLSCPYTEGHKLLVSFWYTWGSAFISSTCTGGVTGTSHFVKRAVCILTHC